MLNKYAEQIHVRPFNGRSDLTSSDEGFVQWSQKVEAPLVVEVGCGAGLHPIFWAKQNPYGRMIAIERTKEKFSAFKNRVTQHQRGAAELTNLFPVNADARDWLPVHISKETIDKYFFLYPNPYPKKSQSNKRFHRSPFMHWIVESLKPEGEIEMASNLPWYINEAAQYMTQLWPLQIIDRRPIPLGFKARTHFEKKYLLRREPCENIRFKKIATPLPRE
ncbi:MAG: hypothetical protein KDD33_05545 [Bdellovibrionales bacterium]|nr:hypothetical protein [Bdellovibrionales bacterium]